jgi:hypothetical protein
MAAEWGELLPLRCHFCFILGNSWQILAVHYGNGKANLAVHVSAPREPWPPLCTVIKETGQTFLTHARDVRSNLVSSRGV